MLIAARIRLAGDAVRGDDETFLMKLLLDDAQSDLATGGASQAAKTRRVTRLRISFYCKSENLIQHWNKDSFMRK